MAICGRATSSSDLGAPISLTLEALRIDGDAPCDIPDIATARLAACDGASTCQRSGRFAAALDGRIDNVDEVRRALNIGAGDARSVADLVLDAYLAWGYAFCRHIVGDFSCAIWDAESRCLKMATDPGGLRPLFYRATDDQVLFASEQRGILADPATPMAIDEHQLAAWLALLPRDPERSFFAGVRRVPPGHLLVWHAGHIQAERWWRPEMLPFLKLNSDADYEAALRLELDRAVRCRLGAGEAIGSNLSGGLDSSAVTAVAAGALAEEGRSLVAFTAAPANPGDSKPGWFGDEWAHAAAVAAMHRNIEHVRIANDTTGLMDALQERESAQDWPLLNPVNAIWVNAIEREAAGRKLDSLLIAASGNYSISHHGNAAFGNMLRRGRLGAAFRTARAMRRNDGRGWASLVRQAAGALMPDRLGRNPGGRSRGGRPALDDYSLVDRDFLRETGLEEIAASTAGDLSHMAGGDSRRLRILGMERSDHLGIQFGSARRLYGVEVRDPTSDRRLVELCLSIPDERFFSDGVPRNLLRRAMSGLVPDMVRNERRRGQQSADWRAIFDRAIPALRAELALLRDSPLASRALDLDRAEALLDTWHVAQAGGDRPALYLAYRLALARGIAAGRFIRRMELVAAGKSGNGAAAPRPRTGRPS